MTNPDRILKSRDINYFVGKVMSLLLNMLSRLVSILIMKGETGGKKNQEVHLKTKMVYKDLCNELLVNS